MRTLIFGDAMYRIGNYNLDPEKVMVMNLKQKGEILSDKNSGRRQDFSMYLGDAATFYNYTFMLHRCAECSVDEWDDLYDLLTDPVRRHECVLPHNQTEMTFEAYISAAYRDLIRVENGKNIWGDIDVEFVATEPQRRY